MGEDRRVCQSTRRDGSPCRAPALPGKPFCFAHDPDMQSVRLEGARRGGRHKARVERLRRLMPEDLRDVFDVLKTALGEVHGGSLKPSQASAMATLATALCRVLEGSDLASRVADLEKKMEASNGRLGA